MSYIQLILNVISYIIQFIGKLTYIALFETSSLVINLYQAIIENKSLPKLSQYLTIKLPETLDSYFIGILTIIFLIILFEYQKKFRIKRYRHKKFLYYKKKDIDNKKLPLNCTRFSKVLKIKNERLLNQRLHHKKININPTEFEYFSAYLFYRSGFSPVMITPISDDYGIDVITTFRHKNYGIQCKFYKSNKLVGIQAIQEVVAGNKGYGLDRSIVITTTTFTVAAKRLAKATDTVLIDASKFNYWQTHPEFIFEILNIKRFPKNLLKYKKLKTRGGELNA